MPVCVCVCAGKHPPFAGRADGSRCNYRGDFIKIQEPLESDPIRPGAAN